MRFTAPLVFTLTACITAPEIVMVDRATALEEQAAGSWSELQARLYRAGMTPTPVPLTPNQLEDLGVRPPPLAENLDETPADRVDALLARRCVGEGHDGLLVETKTPECRRGLRPNDQALVDRVNKARQLLWRWMREQKPGADADAVRRAWRNKHLEGLVCGARVQADDGAWSDKQC